MDEKGNKKDIKNKNEDGTVKADNIYFGYLSGSFYNYALVGKDGKIGAIDYNGAEVSFCKRIGTMIFRYIILMKKHTMDCIQNRQMKHINMKW